MAVAGSLARRRHDPRRACKPGFFAAPEQPLAALCPERAAMHQGDRPGIGKAGFTRRMPAIDWGLTLGLEHR
jgi:hypothetical protein